MKDFMKMLAQHYQIGLTILCSIVILTYVVISVFALLCRRKYYGDLSMLGVIPLVNIWLLFSKKRKQKYLFRLERAEKLKANKEQEEKAKKELAEKSKQDEMFDDIF